MIAFAKPPGTSVARSAEELLAEFRATGAQPAFEELVRRYAAMVFSECYAVTKRRHDAEDAAQATFLTLAVQARTGEEIRHLGPWLQRVARRVALDQEKSRRRRNRREDNHHRINGSTGVATPHRESLDQLELRHQINEELQQLPAKYRMPLILHYFGGLSREQMAEELKCKPATLGVRLFRAREMLGKRLAKRGITLPAAAIPLGIAAIVRENVEQHGFMAMAATASQIAEAATRVAAGLQPTSGTVSSTALALAETASHELVLRKVRAIIAAAAIGVSAIAAGGATVVHKIVDGTLPALFDLNQFFRSLTGPSFDFRVDAVQRYDGTRPAPAEWPSALALLNEQGMLELMRVRQGGSEVSSPTLWSLPQSLTSADLPTPRNAPANSNRGPIARIQPPQPAGGPVLAGPNASENSPVATIGPANGSAPNRDAPREDRAPSAVLPLEDSPPTLASILGGSSSGGGGAGGGGGYAGVFSLAPVPPLASARALPPKSGLPLVPPLGGTSTGFAQQPTVSQQLTTDGDVLRGWGQPALVGELDNSGVVIADGFGQPRTLDLSRVAATYNSIPNPPTGVNGWYARDGGKLVLPAIPVPAGTSRITWGDSPDADSIDLVNAVRITVRDAKHDGLVTISLLASDRPEVPTLPAGYEALTIWSVSGLGSLSASSMDVVARYGLPGSDLAAPLAGLGLFYLDDGHWKSADASIDPSRRLISATDLPLSSLLALLTVADRLGIETLSLTGADTSLLAADAQLDALINPLVSSKLVSGIAAADEFVETVGWISSDADVSAARSLPPVTHAPLTATGLTGVGVVPEPTTIALLGLAGLTLGRRRR